MPRRAVTTLALALTAALACASQAAPQANVGFGGAAYDPDEDVEVTADALTLDQTAGTALFEGDVLIVQGELRIGAARVEVFYTTEEGQDITRVLASGGVTVTSGAEAAEGDSAEYDVDAGTLTMDGDVLVTQGSGAIAGDRLVIDLETGDGQVTGRVRTVLRQGAE